MRVLPISDYFVSTIIVVFALLWPTRIVEAIAFRTVVLSGQTAPGANPGVVFGTTFGDPVINNAGQTVFTASLSSGTSDVGIWSEGSGTLSLVARTGAAVPGTETGVNFTSFQPPVINEPGQVAFMATLTGTNINDQNALGIWSQGSGPLSLVARAGSAAPGTNGAAFTSFNDISYNTPLFNNLGQTAFFAGLTGGDVDSTNDRGIWAERNGSVTLIARKAAPAPGLVDGATFATTRSGFTNPLLTNSGKVGFLSGLAGTGVNSTNGLAHWIERSGNLQVAVRNGTHAPGYPANVNFVGLSGPTDVNDSGEVVFSSEVLGPGYAYKNGIWVENGNGPVPVVLDNQAAPGAGAGVYFDGLDLSPVINNSGAVVFVGDLNGPGVGSNNHSSLWRAQDGSLTMIARAGSQAPGAPPGVTFDAYSFSLNPTELNDQGKVAFIAYLSAAGSRGIFAEGPSGLQLVARTGGFLQVAPGDVRIISSVSFPSPANSNDDGMRSAFNDVGQVAFQASFTDGSSGVFVAAIDPVPEPSSLLLLITSAIGIVATRGRPR